MNQKGKRIKAFYNILLLPDCWSQLLKFCTSVSYGYFEINFGQSLKENSGLWRWHALSYFSHKAHSFVSGRYVEFLMFDFYSHFYFDDMDAD